MSTFLFDQTIFGPISSRRLGVSLGVNLLPTTGKLCSFDCIYCECGFNKDRKPSTPIPQKEQVARELEKVLRERSQKGLPIDHITFAGNGEPTMYPDFGWIIDATLKLRDKYFPDARVAVLSNAAHLHKDSVFCALREVDDAILKLDSAIASTSKVINQTNNHYDIQQVVSHMKRFESDFILQTMMLRGQHNGVAFDNTIPEEVQALVTVVKEVSPRSMQIYSISRDTPSKHAYAVEQGELIAISKYFEPYVPEVLVV